MTSSLLPVDLHTNIMQDREYFKIVESSRILQHNSAIPEEKENLLGNEVEYRTYDYNVKKNENYE